MGRRFGPLLLSLVLAACAHAGPGPEASADSPAAGPEPVRTVGAAFRPVGNGLVYTMQYRLAMPYDSAVRAVAEFENPQRGGTPLTAEATLAPGEGRLVLESEPVFTIRNRTDYQVTLRLYAGSRPPVVHTDRVRFAVPEGMVDTYRRQGIEVE
jgi:hypothetical protein